MSKLNIIKGAALLFFTFIVLVLIFLINQSNASTLRLQNSILNNQKLLKKQKQALTVAKLFDQERVSPEACQSLERNIQSMVFKNTKLTIKKRSYPLSELIMHIAAVANLSIIIDSDVTAEVDININEISAEELFRQLLKVNNLDVVPMELGTYSNKVYRVGDAYKIWQFKHQLLEEYKARQELEQFLREQEDFLRE